MTQSNTTPAQTLESSLALRDNDSITLEYKVAQKARTMMRPLYAAIVGLGVAGGTFATQGVLKESPGYLIAGVCAGALWGYLAVQKDRYQKEINAEYQALDSEFKKRSTWLHGLDGERAQAKQLAQYEQKYGKDPWMSVEVNAPAIAKTALPSLAVASIPITTALLGVLEYSPIGFTALTLGLGSICLANFNGARVAAYQNALNEQQRTATSTKHPSRRKHYAMR